MFDESFYKVSCSWEDMFRFCSICFFLSGVRPFHCRCKNRTASVHKILGESQQKCYRDRGVIKHEPYCVIQWLNGFKVGSTAVEGDDHIRRPISLRRPILLLQFSTSFVRIEVEPFKTLSIKWYLVIEDANKFWLMNWACIVLAQNLCQRSSLSSIRNSAMQFAGSFVSP